MGIAMLLIGIGFLVLSLGVLRPSAVKEEKRRTTPQAVAVPN